VREIVLELDDSESVSPYVDFVTEVVPLENDGFQYLYTVINHLDSTVEYEWNDAGLAGHLEPGAQASRDFVATGSVRGIKVTEGLFYGQLPRYPAK